jgi:flavin reductase
MIAVTDFRNGMALLAGAVNVITTDGPAGLAGFTASAVCSVTDQPPTLLVCMNRSSFAHRHFVENKAVCVNVLSAEQQPLSALFANREVTMDQRFARTPWRSLATGAPALDGALVNFDGQIAHIHEVGSHSIFLVELREVRLNEQDSQGLAYFNRAYHRLGQAPAGAAR